jgi:ribonuclease R
VGATFEGRISGVTRAGLFIKLTETGADGLVPVRAIGAEYFNHDEARHALIGSRSGSMYRLGDVVQVRLVEAAPVAGALRFELLSGGEVGAGRSRQGRSHGRPRKTGVPPQAAIRHKEAADTTSKRKSKKRVQPRTKGGKRKGKTSQRGQAWT